MDVKIVATLLASVASALFVASAMAVVPGKKVEYDVPLGKVTFDGATHAGKGFKCPDCHTKIFKMEKYAGKTTWGQMHGNGCGVCHNGNRAFKATEPANCRKCHKRNPTPASGAGTGP
jgi:c(7)-type cytochrome triheme protein